MILNTVKVIEYFNYKQYFFNKRKIELYNGSFFKNKMKLEKSAYNGCRYRA